jgi:hypothetical protein
MRRRIFSVLPFLAFTSCAFADPTVYGFEGYITHRDNVDAAPLPAGFAIGARLVGTVKFDPTRKQWDPVNEEYRLWPIVDWKLVAPNGDSLKHFWAESSMAAKTSASGEQFSASNVDFELTWHSSETGQLPQDLANLDLSALAPNHWELVGERMSDGCDPQNCVPELISSFSAHLTSLWRQNESPVVNAYRFATNANGWTVQAGEWAAANGYFRNSANLAASIATLAPTTEDRYSIDTKMYLEWSAPGNRGGLVYDYVDAKNYRGVLLSSAKQNSDGSIRSAYIEAFEVRNGARKVTGRVDGLQLYAQKWLNFGIERIGTETRLMLGGAQPALTLTQPVQTGAKRAGLIANYNLVRFDDVVFGVTPR